MAEGTELKAQARDHGDDAYRADIDGLRAIAVLAVIANHFSRDVLPSGYLGVDMFFVISGFVITASVMRAEGTSLGDFALAFYARRVKRLLPALAFCVLVTSLMVAALDEYALRPLHTGAAALLGVSNVYLAFEGVGYFSDSAEMNAFLHTWSLGVEEQFYLLFPLAFWLLYARRGTRSGYRLFIAFVAMGAVVSFALFAALYESHQSYAYYLAPMRAWELGAGVLAYAALNRFSRLGDRMRGALSVFALAVIVLTMATPAASAPLSAFAVVAATALSLVSLNRRTGSVAVALTWRPAVYIGMISYSLYLWHWPVLTLGRLTYGVTPLTAPILLAITFAVATFSYRFIERPLRYASWGGARRRIVGAGIAASLISAGSVFGLGSVHRQVNIANLFGYDDGHIAATWWMDHASGAYLETCMPERAYRPELLDACLSPPGPAPAIYLIGDSHARNYAPALSAAFPDRELRYLTMGYGCAFLPVALAREGDLVNCVAYARDVRARLLAQSRPGDVIAIGQRLADHPERWSGAYVDFLEATAVAFAERGARVIALDGAYGPPTHPRFCLDLPWRPARGGCDVAAAETRAAFSAFDAKLAALATRMETLWYAPLRDGLCAGGVCGQKTAGGSPIWHDPGHITEAAARELAPALLSRLGGFDFDGTARAARGRGFDEVRAAISGP
ncbi:MAG: acyltransferase family protein [Pseudomonadota bacterium]